MRPEPQDIERLFAGVQSHSFEGLGRAVCELKLPSMHALVSSVRKVSCAVPEVWWPDCLRLAGLRHVCVV